MYSYKCENNRERIVKARYELIREQPFFGYLVLNLKIINDDKEKKLPMDTMGVNLRGDLRYRDNFVNQLNDDELKTVLAHEVLHCFKKEGTLINGENRQIDKMKISNKIVSAQGNLIAVEKIGSRHYEGNVLNIKPRGFLPFGVTPQHRFLATTVKWKGFEKPTRTQKRVLIETPKWVEAQNLTTDNWLCIPKIKPLYETEKIKLGGLITGNKWSVKLNEIVLDEDFARFLGLYTADGFYSEQNGSISIVLGKNETEIKDRLLKFYKDRGIKYHIQKRKDCEALRIIMCSKPLGRFLHKNIGTNAHNKKMPQFILYHKNLNLVKAYLRGELDGDGCIYNKKDNKQNYSIATVSQGLALDLQLAFSRFGLIVPINTVKQTPNKLIKYKNTENPIIYKLSSNHNKIVEIIEGKEPQNKRQTNHFLETDEYFLTKINKIDIEQFNGEVYNLKSPSENYCVNNIITHNCGLEHIKRGGNRNPQLFNIAADLAVNWYLKKNGFTIPQGCLISADYDNMFAEEIYEKIAKDAKIVTVWNKVAKYNPQGDMVKDKDGDGEGQGKDGKKKEQEGEDLGGTEKSDKEAEGEVPEEIDWKEKMVEAAQRAKMMGKSPVGMERFFEKSLFPENNWRAILYKFINKSITQNSNFNRPNRRFISRGLYMPAKIRENMDIVFAVDTSGSISEKMLGDFYRELITVRDSFANINITILTCDTEIHEVIVIKNHETPEIEMKGGGGTSFKEPFLWVEENKPNAKILIYLTDLYGDFPEFEAGNCRTLWAIPKSSEGVEIPFGEKLVINNDEESE